MASQKPSRGNNVRPSERIAATHELTEFDCGVPSLNDWLRRRAVRNESDGASRTYVVCTDPGTKVVGYYSLATGAMFRAAAPGKVRRNMPEPIPVMIIGRLAVDRAFQGKGLGRALLRDAILRMLQAARIAGIRAILVHAITEQARQFYLRCGFRHSPLDPMTLMVTVAEAEKAMRP